MALDIGELPLLRRRLEVKLKLRVEHVPVVAQYPAQGRQLAVYHPPLEVVPRPQLFEPALLFLPARSFLSTFPHASWMRFPSGSSPLSSFSFQTWYAVCAAENSSKIGVLDTNSLNPVCNTHPQHAEASVHSLPP